MSKLINTTGAKKFILANMVYFVICFLCLLVGIIIGVIIMLKAESSLEIFTQSTLSLADIINGDYKAVSLFFSCFFGALVSCLIMFVLGLTKYTIFLNYIYICYQGLLLGASCASLITLKGVSGALNVFIFVLPINILNMVAIILMQVLLLLSQSYAKKFRATKLNSLAKYGKNYLVVLALVIISSLCYGVLYPLLLKSIIIVNY